MRQMACCLRLSEAMSQRQKFDGGVMLPVLDINLLPYNTDMLCKPGITSHAADVPNYHRNIRVDRFPINGK
jgi:hypothetical protein